MPSPTHITSYASDALALLTGRYSMPRPDPAPTPEDELGAIAWQRATGASAAVTVPASKASQGASFFSLSAPGSVVLPASPSDGEVVWVNDEDGTGVTEGVVISGGTIVDQGGTSASTYTFSTAAHGYAEFSSIMLSWIAAAGVWKVLG